MSYRQSMWGLSNGVLVLTFAGGFWLGIIGSVVQRPEIAGPAGLAAVVALLCGFVHLRHKSSGFSFSEMKNGNDEQRASLRHIRRGLRWVMLLETALSGLAIGTCEFFHRVDLIWSALGIAVSLHFVPLGWLFRVRRYYFTAIVGTVACLVALCAFSSPRNTVFASAAMCLNMWGMAAWLIFRSENIARQTAPLSTSAVSGS